MIDLVQKQKIILKHRGGDSNRQIAAELGIDKNTVNKYVSALGNSSSPETSLFFYCAYFSLPLFKG